MKKILLSLGLFSLVLMGRAQTVLNEVYTDPGAGKSEFIELYNSSVGSQNVDCFTILTYWSSGANKGWYVIDLPNATIAPKGWYVLASASPFNVQSQSGITADVNWNSMPASGYLKKYQQSGAGYIEVAAGTVTDLLVDGDFYTGANYLTLLFQNGAFINGFWGGGPPPGVLPVGITGMNDLPVDMLGACSDFTVDFSTLGSVEYHNPSGGTDNGYARTSDGKCGSWTKTSSSVNHTPGVSNGGAAGLSGALVTAAEILQCNTAPGLSKITYNITGVSGDASEAADFPVEVQLYYDYGTLGQLDGADVYQSSLIDAAIADPAKSFDIVQNQYVILVYKTKRGCFDKVVAIANGCLPLPVSFKSFTATRNQSNVLIKWETAWEQNNSGFAVERNVNGSWEQIAWVATQAQNGNSDALLTYTYMDYNNIKGITQYRIRQVDFDEKATYSIIRSVRGEGQLGTTIVYPNPSNNGKVNILFENTSVTREISVADMSGRIVRQIKGISNNNITIENLNPGMYTIRIVAVETGEQVVEKVVVNKR